MWRYKAIYRLHDEQVGQWSDTLLSRRLVTALKTLYETEQTDTEQTDCRERASYRIAHPKRCRYNFAGFAQPAN